jgi:hypothetical protein
MLVLALLVSSSSKFAFTALGLSHKGQRIVRWVGNWDGSDRQILAFMQAVPKACEHAGNTHSFGDFCV